MLKFLFVHFLWRFPRRVVCRLSSKWLVSLLGAVSLFADKAPIVIEETPEELPWFTGPLIAPSSVALTRGQINIEPYFYATANTGVYNSEWKAVDTPTIWNFNLAPLLYFGLNNFIDITCTPSFLYNVCQHQKNWALGDLNFGFDFQLYVDDYFEHDWYPNLKLTISENFPVGKYDNLDPKKQGTQLGGNGSFQTEIQFVMGKLIRLTGIYYFSTRLALTYIIPSPVTVRGFNSYGGGYGAYATVYPAQTFTADYAFEVNLSKNWVFATDIIGNWLTRTHYKGNPGTNVDGAPAKIGPGSAFQFTLAPALEYNWNANIGLIFGLWFTAAGRNAPQFYSGVVAFNYFK